MNRWTGVEYLLGAGLGWFQFLTRFKTSSAILTPVLSCSPHFILGKLFHLNGFIWCRSSIWLYYPRDGSAGSPVKKALFDLDKSPFVHSLATDHHPCCHHCSRHWKRWFETTNKAIKPPFLKISEDSRQKLFQVQIEWQRKSNKSPTLLNIWIKTLLFAVVVYLLVCWINLLVKKILL